MSRRREQTNIYSVRLSDVDRAAFNRAAIAAGLPRSKFLRSVLDDAIRAYRVYQNDDKNQLTLF